MRGIGPTPTTHTIYNKFFVVYATVLVTKAAYHVTRSFLLWENNLSLWIFVKCHCYAIQRLNSQLSYKQRRIYPPFRSWIYYSLAFPSKRWFSCNAFLLEYAYHCWVVSYNKINYMSYLYLQRILQWTQSTAKRTQQQLFSVYTYRQRERRINGN